MTPSRVLPSRADRALLLALYVVVASARLPLYGVVPYFDEGAFYYIAKHAWLTPPNLIEFSGHGWVHWGPDWFWERPLYYALMAPVAWVSFEAYRVTSILISSLLPVLGALLLRELGVRRLLAYAPMLGFAFWHQFYPWGILVHMDPIMAVVVTYGLWLWLRGAWRVALVLFVAGAWIKPSAVLVILALLVLSVAKGVRHGATSLWPLRATRQQVLLAAALPLAAAWTFFTIFTAYFPGNTVARPDVPMVVGHMFLSTWFVPLLLVGLLVPRARLLCLLALMSAGGIVYMHAFHHREYHGWYAILSGFFTVAGVSVVLDEAWTRASRVSLRWPKPGVAAVAGAFVALLLVSPVVETSLEKSQAITPGSRRAIPTVREMFVVESARERDFEAALHAMGPQAGARFLMLDLYYPKLLWVADQGATIYFGLTFGGAPTQALRPYTHTMENLTQMALFPNGPGPLLRAIHTTYADCIVHENPAWFVVEGPRCPGREPRLRQALEEEVARQAA